MASEDWAEVDGNQSSGTVARGVTAGVTPPNGGGSFVFGFNSLSATPGAVGFTIDGTANSGANERFAPMQTDSSIATGGSIRGVLQRGISSEPQTGFAPMLFLHLKSGITTTPNVNDVGYLLGLEDSNPARIVLRKGALNGGLTVDTSLSTLRISSAAYNPGTWVHVRLDAIYNQNGDVVLKVYQNDLTTYTVTNPTWVPVPGMTDFIDDVLTINSGTAPLSGGFCGFSYYSSDLQKRAFVDQVQLLRQK